MEKTRGNGKNQNHPAKGSQTKVEPIRELKDIKNIKKLLSDNPLYLALFLVGINTNLRASDLLRITAGQVKGIKPMGEIELREKKTGKVRRISLNKPCADAIAQLFKSRQYEDEDPIFTGQRGVLTVPSMSRLVKTWCKAIHLKGHYAAHSLRKTWGYHQRKTFGVGLPELVECFNHSTQKQTMTYLCIQPDEIRNVYAHEI
jgi:integrase